MTATDSEWQQVSEQAKIADMTISRYVIERLIQTLDISEASVKTDNFPASVNGHAKVSHFGGNGHSAQ